MLGDFKTPPPEYRPAPFWFWNSRLDRNEIERQIREMHSKGVGGFFIHGRFGLKTEYLSDEWMACIEKACETAIELGMYVWLYDENPFPSGVGGGEVMKNIRHHNKFLDYSRTALKPGELTDIAVDTNSLVSVSAVNEELKQAVDLTQDAASGRIKWTASDKGWELLIVHARTAFSNSFIYGSEPDYFEPTMMPAYLRHTHERYASYLEKYFGDPIIGIFTDEPKMQCIYHQHEDSNTSAWFDELPQEFMKDHGYELIPNLPALFADVGEDPGKVRRDYWTTLSRRYISRYFEPYRRWCERNSLVFTGHLFLEEGLYANTMYQGDYPHVLREFHMPGVDHLATSIESDYVIPHIPMSITRTHGNKIAASGAHITGANRVLSETFGCCGWGLSMEEMKWIADWQFTLGVNFLCPHAFYYSIAGARKTDAPPSQFYQSTFWPHYKIFADYVARLSYALTRGNHKAQVALLYPSSSFRSEWTPGRIRQNDELIAGYFDMYCKHLMAQHLDYDVITESDLAAAGISDGKLILGDESYELLILPPLTVIEAAAAAAIKHFIDSGGALLASVSRPSRTTEGADITHLVTDIAHRPERVILVREQDPDSAASILRKTVEQLITPDVSVRIDDSECQDVTCVRRITEEGDIFFFANGAAEEREVTISLRGVTGVPVEWSLETGTTAQITSYHRDADAVEINWTFPPRGSLLLTVSETVAQNTQTTRQDVKPAVEIVLDDKWQFAVESPNVMILRDWKLDILTMETRIRYSYTRRIELDFIPDRLWLLLDDLPPVGVETGNASSKCSVFVNGCETIPEGYEWFTDIAFQMIDIRPFVSIGDNQLEIRIDHEGWAGEPKLMNSEPRLLGDFALENAGEAWKPVPPTREVGAGSWTEFRYPFFSGTGVYSQDITLERLEQNARVYLQVDDAADMVEIWVNENQAGVRPWRPFKVDVSAFLTEGRNRISVKVVNSLQNMLTGEPKASGLLGAVRLIVYEGDGKTG